MRKQGSVSLAIDYSQHMWAINFNWLYLYFPALCKCRLITLHKPFKQTHSMKHAKAVLNDGKMEITRVLLLLAPSDGCILSSSCISLKF